MTYASQLPLQSDADLARLSKSGYAPLLRSLAVSVAAVIALLSFVRLDLAECSVMLSRTSPSLYVAMLAIYLTMYALRAVRLQIVLPVRVGIARLTGAAMIHQFYATFLPMKVGEFALPMLLKNDGVRRAQTLGILLVMRVCDLTALALALGIALLAFRGTLPASMSMLWPVQIVSLLVSMVCIVVLLMGPRATLAILNYLGRWRHGEEHVPGWLAGRIDDLDQAVRMLSAPQVLLANVATVGIFLLDVIFGVMFCHQVVPGIPLSSLVVACIAMPLVSQIPVQGLAGIGTSEAIMLAVFSLAGLPESEALSLGIVSHAVQLGLVSVVGLIGMALRRIRHSQPAPSLGRDAVSSVVEEARDLDTVVSQTARHSEEPIDE